MAKKGIIRTLTLREISAVDNPAQEHARVVIMKRAGEEGATMTKEEEDKLKKDLSDTQAALAARDSEKAALAAQNAELAVMATLSDEEKDHHKSLSKEDGAAFLKKSASERGQIIIAKKAGEEILKVDGKEIRKSVVGADMFAILKSQQAAIEANRVALEKANKEAQTATLRKRAGDELAKLPGTEDEKVEILRSIDAIADENVRKAALAALKAGNSALAKAFDTFGSEGGNEPANIAKGKQDFNAKVEEVMKRDNISRSSAIEKVTDQHPELHAAAFGEMRAVPEGGRRASATH